MDRQIRRLIIETKQRSHPEVTIDRVNIERRNGMRCVYISMNLRVRRANRGSECLEIVFSGNCA